MTFEQYWVILLSRWKLTLVCCLLVGAGALAGSRLITPLYESTALVQVADNSDRSVYNALLASQQLVQTEVVLATSDPVLRAVASHFNGLTSNQLAHEVTAVTKFNTQLFEIDVRDPHPIRAADLANDIVATLAAQQARQFQHGATRITLDTVQVARPGQSPVTPDIRLNTGIGLVAGLLFGMLLALLRGQANSRVRTPKALTKLLDLPVLATVHCARPRRKGEVIHPAENSANGDSYRDLGTNIEFLSVEAPLRSLLITSALPHEGKTCIASNLALLMAKDGKATLLVDANLSHPTLHTMFDLPTADNGLSNAVLAMNMLSAEASPGHPRLSDSRATVTQPGVPILDLFLAPYIQSASSPNLWVMPSGPLPPDAPKLLASKGMQWLLAAVAGPQFDVVIFDGPPLLGKLDADVLAAKVDVALLAVDARQASERNLKQAKSRLLQAGTRNLGCVVTKQRKTRRRWPF
jgi:Mrp family chromosome partitioning ATPase